jgi:hypothetical protein
MAGFVLIDELHLTILVPKRLSEADTAAIHRILKSTRFQRTLREPIRKAFRQFRALDKARFTISR